jgi:cellulose synthase/poly-beta-1,6-N-acetylglucosamine synthase-like glycosyltransferase
MTFLLKILLKFSFCAWFIFNAALIDAATAGILPGHGILKGYDGEVPVIEAFLWSTLWLYGITVAALTAAALKRAKKPGYTKREDGKIGPPGVSVVIPFKYEEHSLNALLESIGKQSYKGIIEAVLVDYGTGDNGVSAISIANDRIPIKSIHLQGNSAQPPAPSNAGKTSNKKLLTSKQQALDLGAAESSCPLIAFADHDIIPTPDWIETLVNTQMSLDADLVFGHTAINALWDDNDTGKRGIVTSKKTSRFSALLESYRNEFLSSFAYAASKLGLACSCKGNNILAVKSSYLECGGQAGVRRSGAEGAALLRLFRKKGYRVAASEPFAATAETRPSRSNAQFLSETARRARGLRPGGSLFTAMILLLAQNTVFLLCLLGVITGEIVLQSAANFLLTWLFLAIAFKKIRSPATNFLFPIYYIIIPAGMIMVGLAMIFGRKK